MSFYPDHPHRRFNPLNGEWVLVSPHRMKRPWQGKTESPKIIQLPEHDAGCYLCPGNRRVDGKTNLEYSGTYVFDNDFTAILNQPLENGVREYDLDEVFQFQTVHGTSRVICFSPNHALTLPEIEQEQILEVIGTWQSQMEELGQTYRSVQIFENKGAEMGCSNPHPHGQIWASNQLPTITKQEDVLQRAFYEKHGESLLFHYGKEELKKKTETC
jgi:UDPglucose--hexose-1-phosphate uridylyltransferase